MAMGMPAGHNPNIAEGIVVEHSVADENKLLMGSPMVNIPNYYRP